MIRRPPRSTLFPSTPLSRPLPGGRGPRRPPRYQLSSSSADRRHTSNPSTGSRTSSSATSGPRCSRHSARRSSRSEEHTSELQSPCNLVCRLLLEKKKKNLYLQVCQFMWSLPTGRVVLNLVSWY